MNIIVNFLCALLMFFFVVMDFVLIEVTYATWLCLIVGIINMAITIKFFHEIKSLFKQEANK